MVDIARLDDSTHGVTTHPQTTEEGLKKISPLLYLALAACVQGTPVEPDHTECRVTLYLTPHVENDRITLRPDSGSISRTCG